MSIDTVNDISPRVQYTATASQTAFDYPFPIFAESDIVVDVDGTTKVLSTDYAVTGEGDDAGGTVTFLTGRTAGEVVTLYRETAIERVTDLLPGGSLSSANINDDLDRLVIIAQELNSNIERSVRLTDVDDTVGDMTLPASRAGMYFTFDANGLPAVASGTGADTALRADLASGAAAASVLVNNTGVRYPRTTREIAASITPSNTSYRPSDGPGRGDVRRWGCVCDGVTDDTVAFQRAIDSVTFPGVSYGKPGGYLYVPSNMRLTSSILIENKFGLTIEIDRYSRIIFDDGAYVGLRFKGGQQCKIINGAIYGNNATAPAITLVRVGETSFQCPLFVMEDVTLAFAAICVHLANTYITTLRGNNYSNAFQFVKSGGLGSCTAIQMIGEIFGAANFGNNTNYNVDIQSNGTQLVGCYWENIGQGQNALKVTTGSQSCALIGGFISNSGGIKVETSTDLKMLGVRMENSYDATNLSAIRVVGGNTLTMSGCIIQNNTLPAGVTGVSASSASISVIGCMINKWATGISSSSNGSIIGNQILNCTTGVSSNGAATIIDGNYFEGNTTALAASTAATVGKNTYSGNTTNVTKAGTAYIDESVRGATASVADGGTITHGHCKTPTVVTANSSVAGEFASVTAIGATTFTVAIKKHDNTAGTTQTIYWEVSG